MDGRSHQAYLRLEPSFEGPWAALKLRVFSAEVRGNEETYMITSASSSVVTEAMRVHCQLVQCLDPAHPQRCYQPDCHGKMTRSTVCPDQKSCWFQHRSSLLMENTTLRSAEA